MCDILDMENVTVLKDKGSLVQNKLVRQMKNENDVLRNLPSQMQPLTICDNYKMVNSSHVDNNQNFKIILSENKQRMSVRMC